MTTSSAYGLPGIEIGRFAEHVRADLLVLGRKQRSRGQRLLLGDTADAVARRSRIPCLFVPASGMRRRAGCWSRWTAPSGARPCSESPNDFAGQIGAELGS